MVGDGEAETAPLATSWHPTRFLNPIRDGACCRSASQRLQDQQPDHFVAHFHDELENLFKGLRPGKPYFVEGQRPAHDARGKSGRRWSSASPKSTASSRWRAPAASRSARAGRDRAAQPKGWTGPKEVDGKKVEGFWRAHQVPIGT